MSVIPVVDYATVDLSKLMEIVSKVAAEAANSEGGSLGVDEALVRIRNIFVQVFGLDISMNNAGQPVYKTSIYSIEEIDADGEFFELSLKDLTCGLFVIVDITESDLQSIRNEGIGEGDIIATSLRSIPNNLEVTGDWKLWGNVRKVS